MAENKSKTFHYFKMHTQKPKILDQNKTNLMETTMTPNGTKIFQYCTCPAGRVTYNFHLSCKHMHLSFKSVCNKEHNGVICNMSYKVPYITAKMVFTQSVS